MSEEKPKEYSTPLNDRERMRTQLNETHKWPCDFMFKFIVPKGNENEAALRAIFGLKSKMKMRESSTGKYRSFTILVKVTGADEVFDRYEAAAKITGIIAL
jgi:putative lipoic acid-binding regulatory protein